MGVTDNQLTWRGVTQISGVRGVWPAANAARVNEDAYLVGAGTVIIYTVPASKKLFIASCSISASQSAAAITRATVHVRNVGDVIQYNIFHHVFYTSGQQVAALSFMPALEAVAGWDVCLYNSHANLSSRGLFTGWLEDA